MGFFWLLALLLILRWVFPRPGEGLLPEQTRRMEGELERLRTEVERLSGQVDRLVDEQSFLLRLLDAGDDPPALGAGRPDPDAGPDPPEDTPAAP